MNGLPKDFSIEVFNKELEDLADRVNAHLKECKDSLCDELDPHLSTDRGDGVTNTDTLQISINPVRHNISLLLYMLKMVDDCTGWNGCPGDSGDVHCILCRHNVLSTEELQETNWSELNGQV